MATFVFVLSILLMIPFLGWGIYTLRVRYLLHEELSPATEVATLAGVIVFLTLQLLFLRVWVGSVELFYTFSMLALVAASTALYGPTLVSLASQTVVNVIQPPNEQHENEPHFGPAEALEGTGDYESALREYMVMARIFPKHPEPAFRVANVLCELERYDQATESFERGIRLSQDPERALIAVTRLSDIYLHRLDAPDRAAESLEEYLEQFPEAPRAHIVRRKIERLAAKAGADSPDSPILPSSDLLEPPSAGQ